MPNLLARRSWAPLASVVALVVVVAILASAAPGQMNPGRRPRQPNNNNNNQVKTGLQQEIDSLSAEIVKLSTQIAAITPQADAAMKAADEAAAAATDAHKAVDGARKIVDEAREAVAQAAADLDAATKRIKDTFEVEDKTVAARKAVADAQQEVDAARAKALAPLRETTDYKTAAAALRQAQAHLDALKTASLPDPMAINYQSAIVLEKQAAVAKLEQPVLDADADCAAADAKLQIALAAEKKLREGLAVRILRDADWIAASKAVSDAQAVLKTANAAVTEPARKLSGLEMTNLMAQIDAKRLGDTGQRLEADRTAKLAALANLQEQLRNLH